jgi:AcrR family transcriptional regulator
VADLTARARIVDAAIEVFAEQGATGASMRAIAAKAGVSPALITHHFGTKDALKAECDERILAAYSDIKMTGIADLAAVMGVFSGSDRTLERLSAYFLRTILDGGEAARRFFADYLARTEQIMDEAVRRGQVRPECADAAHVRYLAAAGVGALIVGVLIEPEGAGAYYDAVRHPELVDAELDTLTHGVFADDSVLRAFRTAFPPAADAIQPDTAPHQPATEKENHV